MKFRHFASFGIPRFCGFRDFEDSEISRILKFLAVPVLCRDNVIHVRKRGARRAGAAVCLERVSARPTMPAMPHDRSGASLGNSKISDFEIFVVRFGSHLPFLALSCVQSLSIGGTFRFLQNFPENI